jgi:hypothetical protein
MNGPTLFASAWRNPQRLATVIDELQDEVPEHDFARFNGACESTDVGASDLPASMELRWLRRALTNLDAIAQYIARDDPDAARSPEHEAAGARQGHERHVSRGVHSRVTVAMRRGAISPQSFESSP